MRVPSIGLPLDERRIVREGYRLAERMLANYQDPPGLITTARLWLAQFRIKAPSRY
jgi:hypothetical protein